MPMTSGKSIGDLFAEFMCDLYGDSLDTNDELREDNSVVGSNGEHRLDGGSMMANNVVELTNVRAARLELAKEIDERIKSGQLVTAFVLLTDEATPITSGTLALELLQLAAGYAYAER